MTSWVTLSPSAADPSSRIWLWIRESQQEVDFPWIPQQAGGRGWAQVRALFHFTLSLSPSDFQLVFQGPPLAPSQLPILISQGHFHINLGFLCYLWSVTLPMLYHQGWLIRNCVSVVMTLEELLRTPANLSLLSAHEGRAVDQSAEGSPLLQYKGKMAWWRHRPQDSASGACWVSGGARGRL